MRKFRLLSSDKKLSFDLSNNVVAAEPKGLGNRFALEYLDTIKGKRLSNVLPNFETIQLLLYFNADGRNGYGFYNNLMSFLAAVGLQTFLFEYNDGIKTKLCDVVLGNAPKSEISEDGEFAETFAFDRQSYWFEELQESFALKTYQGGGDKFPLRFPFRFSGVYFQKHYTVNNQLAIEAPVIIRVRGKIKYNIHIYVDDVATDERFAEIQLSTNNIDGHEILIDPTDKKVTRATAEGKENIYGLLNHNKHSFIYLPKGLYKIGSNLDDEDTGAIEISVRRFLFD